MTNAVKLDLPKATSTADIQKPEKIEFAIDASGALFWNGERLTPRGRAGEVRGGGPEAAAARNLPARRPERPYRYVAEMLADASKAGLSKVAFVSEPVK